MRKRLACSHNLLRSLMIRTGGVFGPPPARLRTAQRSSEAELKAESSKIPIIETHLSLGV
jgi:hypothetical protein